VERLDRIETLHEAMDRSLEQLIELPEERRVQAADALLRELMRDLRVERRLLAERNVLAPGLSGVDPLAMLQRGELDRLIEELRAAAGGKETRWRAALCELRLQLDAAFVAVDLARPDRG
jgi:hypothetical protein